MVLIVVSNNIIRCVPAIRVSPEIRECFVIALTPQQRSHAILAYRILAASIVNAVLPRINRSVLVFRAILETRRPVASQNVSSIPIVIPVSRASTTIALILAQAPYVASMLSALYNSILHSVSVRMVSMVMHSVSVFQLVSSEMLHVIPALRHRVLQQMFALYTQMVWLCVIHVSVQMLNIIHVVDRNVSQIRTAHLTRLA